MTSPSTYPYLIYELLVWGSKIDDGYPLYLLQKESTEDCCKLRLYCQL